MAGQQSAAVDRALKLVARGLSVSEAARRTGVALTTVRRALRRAGVPPLPNSGRPRKQQQQA